jgi:hypothetical protein
MADKKTADPAEQAVSVKDVQPDISTDVRTADLGPANSAETIRLAEDLPAKDAVQSAYKDALTTEDPHAEARGYLKAAEESPNALDTPSGYALKKSIGVSNDTERGEKYIEAKSAKRWGYAAD